MDLKNDFWINELQRIGKVGVFSYDIKNNIVSSSELGCELFGIGGNQMNNEQDWLNVIHPSQRVELSLYFMEVIKTGGDFDKEFRLVSEENERWVQLKGKVFFDECHMPEKLSGTIQDVSEIKKSEARYKKLYMEFQEKEALLVSLINSIPDLIFYKDINSLYLGCNKAYATYLGMNEKDIIGRSDFDIFGEEVASPSREMDIEMIEQEEHRIYEKWSKYPDGKDVLLDTLKTPYYNHKGKVLGIIGVSRDITERNKEEKLQKMMEEEVRRINELKETERIKTEFVTNISHELKTPINVIYSALQMEELMLNRFSSENVLEDKFRYTKMMRQNCYRLLRLIGNLIDITKFDHGFIAMHESNRDIISSIENVVLSVADYIENKDISITFDTDVEEKIIAFDPEKMDRIILNLLSNAVKFTPCGGKIDVYIEDNTDYICIRLKDNGSGIPESKLDSIFERFVQVDRSLTRSHEGSGIGLSIVKALVEQHGGKISITSKVGQGTEFIINIPCKLIRNKASVKSAEGAKISQNSIDRINIEFSDIYN